MSGTSLLAVGPARRRRFRRVLPGPPPSQPREVARPREWPEALGLSPELAAALNDCSLSCTADQVARAAGIPNAYAMNRTLRREGLPPFRPLRNWCYVLGLLQRSQDRGWSLARHAIRSGTEPGAYYRFLRRTTGRTWSELQELGLTWAMGAAARAWEPFLRRSDSKEGWS